MSERVAVLRRTCEDMSRDFDEIELSVHSDLALSSTHEAAEETFSRAASRYGQDVESQRGLWVVGTPDEVIAQLGRYADIGVSHWIAHFDDPFDANALGLLRHEVVPAFRCA